MVALAQLLLECADPLRLLVSDGNDSSSGNSGDSGSLHGLVEPTSPVLKSTLGSWTVGKGTALALGVAMFPRGHPAKTQTTGQATSLPNQQFGPTGEPSWSKHTDLFVSCFLLLFLCPGLL